MISFQQITKKITKCSKSILNMISKSKEISKSNDISISKEISKCNEINDNTQILSNLPVDIVNMTLTYSSNMQLLHLIDDNSKMKKELHTRIKRKIDENPILSMCLKHGGYISGSWLLQSLLDDNSWSECNDSEDENEYEDEDMEEMKEMKGPDLDIYMKWDQLEPLLNEIKNTNLYTSSINNALRQLKYLKFCKELAPSLEDYPQKKYLNMIGPKFNVFTLASYKINIPSIDIIVSYDPIGVIKTFDLDIVTNYANYDELYIGYPESVRTKTIRNINHDCLKSENFMKVMRRIKKYKNRGFKVECQLSI